MCLASVDWCFSLKCIFDSEMIVWFPFLLTGRERFHCMLNFISSYAFCTLVISRHEGSQHELSHAYYNYSSAFFKAGIINTHVFTQCILGYTYWYIFFTNLWQRHFSQPFLFAATGRNMAICLQPRKQWSGAAGWISAPLMRMVHAGSETTIFFSFQFLFFNLFLPKWNEC